MLTTRLRQIGILSAAALIAVAFAVKPASAVGTDNPPPDTKKEKKDGKAAPDAKQEQHAKFLKGYRAARQLIVDGKYAEGIAAMHALGRDDHADVRNYIGYANRKLGKYDESKKWYDLALSADPKHTRTWSYYGMWHAEQGNRLMANDYLQKVKLLCGTENCQEFIELKAVIDDKASY